MRSHGKRCRLWPRRRGYALMLVVVFLALFFSIFGLVQQRIATNLRIEKLEAIRVLRDEGSVRALAQVLTTLETGVPPVSPYVCLVPVVTPSGTRNFTARLSLGSLNEWTVTVAPNKPGDNTVALPASFSLPVSVLK